MSTNLDQQPIGRTIGRRKERDGQLLSASDRDAMTRNAGYLTRAPKGLFFYSSAEEMDADRRRWTVDAVVDKARERSK
jgi:hypothetical protein